jgi:polyhydroxybutyrate depolymerase
MKPFSRFVIRILSSASVLLIVSLGQSNQVLAQGNCGALENQLKGLEAARSREQLNLQRAAGEEKLSLVQQIRELESEIRQVQIKLDRCKGITMNWNVAGRARQALVFPPATITQHHPLIFAWHGHGGTMQHASQQMGFQTLWPDAIVVYPQGLDQHATGNGWQKEIGEDGNRDLKFFDAMLATLRQKYPVYSERIYTTGFSNGTGFSYLLWAERGNTLAAIGAVAGVLARSEKSRLHQPRPLIAIFGTDPHTAPAEIKEKTIQAARKVNHALASEESCHIPNGASDCKLYPSTSKTPVKNVIHAGGHEYLPWMAEEIVKFFQEHRKP